MSPCGLWRVAGVSLWILEGGWCLPVDSGGWLVSPCGLWRVAGISLWTLEGGSLEGGVSLWTLEGGSLEGGACNNYLSTLFTNHVVH